jgi:hypothetical protein
MGDPHYIQLYREVKELYKKKAKERRPEQGQKRT